MVDAHYKGEHTTITSFLSTITVTTLQLPAFYEEKTFLDKIVAGGELVFR